MGILEAIKSNIDEKLDDETKNKIFNDMKNLIEKKYVSFNKDYKDYIKNFIFTLFRSFNIFIEQKFNIDLDLIKITKVDDDADREVIRIIDVNRILRGKNKININEIINIDDEDFDKFEVLIY